MGPIGSEHNNGATIAAVIIRVVLVLREMAGGVAIGPVLMGLSKPVFIVSNSISER